MKPCVITPRGITLLTASGLMCLWAGAAHCQRSGRQISQAGQAGACRPTNSTSQTSSASTTTQSALAAGTASHSATTATTASTYQILAQRSALASSASAGQGASAFSAQRISASQALVRWSGNTSNAQRVFVGILDANGQVLDQRVVTQLPVQANLTLTNTARYFGVRVVFANGASNTFYSPIQ